MLIALSITLLWLLVAGLCLQDIVRERLAPVVGGASELPLTGPLISVLIPARDEAARLRPLLEGLAAQSYRSFEVILVDDHSSDGTAELARSYAARLPALTVQAGAPLPTGWAGKCWACWQAAGLARGEWLIFLDADVAPAPALLAALAARRGAADLITLMPLLQLGSLAERLVLPAFGSILYGLYPLAAVSDRPAAPPDPQRPAFANGQVIAISRAAYDRSDGHRAVRASVLEDVELGRAVRASGGRLLAAHAPELCSVRMYTTWPEIVEGLGKNALAGYRSGGWRSGWVGMRQTLIALGPLYLLLAAAALGASGAAPALVVSALLHGLTLWLLAAGCYGWLLRRRYRIGLAWGLAYPLGLALYYGLALRAALLIGSGRGVRWKGRRLAG